MARKKASVGIQQLLDRTGGAKLRATVEVDQPYAQDQHETLFYRHPRGGQAKFLEEPLMSKHPQWLQKFASSLLNARRDASALWAETGRSLVREVEKNAPREFGDLRNSGALTVREGSSIVVSEPAKQPRLSEAELDAKDHMRAMGVSYR